MNNALYASLFKMINDGIMISLALMSGYFLILEEVTILTQKQLARIDLIDTIIALIFLFEFFIILFLEKDRGAYFKARWWELLAAIPISTTATQALRLLRLLRVVRLFRIGAHIAMTKEK